MAKGSKRGATPANRHNADCVCVGMCVVCAVCLFYLPGDGLCKSIKNAHNYIAARTIFACTRGSVARYAGL